MGWWVSTWMVECVRCSGCLTCFVLWFSGPTMVVSPLSLDLYYCCILYVICCTADVHGWVDRFVGVTGVSGWVNRSVAVTMMCVPVVSPPLRGVFFSFSILSIYTGTALASFSVPLLIVDYTWYLVHIISCFQSRLLYSRFLSCKVITKSGATW